MRYILPLVFLIFIGCAKPLFYSYKATMAPATETDSLTYENDTMRIRFTLDPKAVTFRLNNKLNDGMQIKWDEVSISIKGKAYRVVHKETGVYKIRDVQPSTSIPPQSYLTDGFIPVEKINYVNTSNGTIVYSSDIFPAYNYGNKATATKISALVGADVIIYMPIYIGGHYTSKSFHIRINDIISRPNGPYQSRRG